MRGLLPILLLALFAAPAFAAAPGSVALVTIAEPDGYAVLSSSGAPQYDSRTFIAPGTGAPASFAQAMAAENLHLGRELAASLTEALQRAGTRVLAGNESRADAKLTVAIAPHSVAYSDEVLGDDLMPGFAVSVVLSDAGSGAVRFARRILYGEAGGPSAHALYPDARFRFTSAEAVLADPKSAAEGFRAGIALVADEIAREVMQ
jgi:hypothetical protein